MAKNFSNALKPKRFGSGAGDLGASITQGANLETMRYQNKAALPTQHENDAQLFSDLGKQFSAPGDRPRGAWRNFGAGITKGLEYGAKSKAIGERKENYDKYEKVMNYFQEVNNAAVEQNQWYEKREGARKELMPQVLAYMDNIERLDPQSQRIMAQDMLAQYGSAIGEDFKLSSIDGSNPFLMTIQSEKGQQLFDLRSMFAGDEAVQQSIAMKMPAYQEKLQQERADKDREFNLKEDKLALEEQYMPDKYAVQREKLAETTRRNDQNAIKSDMKLNDTLGKKIDASREFLTIAPKMEQIVREHPDIFQSAIDATWRESGEPGFINNMLKDAQNSWNPDKVAALTSMVKYINKMTLDVANGFARPNMFIEKIGSKAVPNLDMNPQGFLKVLEEMKQENETSIKNNQRRLKLFEQQEGKPLSQDYQKSTEGVMGEPKGSSNVVTITNPETGESVKIDESQVDAAIAGGWEVSGGLNG